MTEIIYYPHEGGISEIYMEEDAQINNDQEQTNSDMNTQFLMENPEAAITISIAGLGGDVTT